MIAALYVDVAHGPYAAMGVDCWGVERNATTYPGPGPVIAHPPCGHWGRYSQRCRDDGRTGPVAVEQVRRFGGVLEQPRHSKLWAHCGLPRPGEMPDRYGGWAIEVRQVDFGHVAEKATWLYIVGVDPRNLPALPPRRPTPEPAYRKPSGRLSTALERMSKTERHLTPPSFAAWLVDLAGRVRS